MAGGRSDFTFPRGLETAESASTSKRRPGSSSTPDLTLLVEGFPEQRTAVVRARGAIDEATAPQFAEFLNGRMCGTMTSLVLDLSGLDSLDAAGMDAVRQTYQEARRHGIELSIVTTVGSSHP